MSKDKDKNLSRRLIPELWEILQVVIVSALLIHGVLQKDLHMLVAVIGLILLGILIDLKLSH